MYTKKIRAELADICYMTIEKECSKPLKEINTELIDACIELANKLLDIKPLSEEELLSAKKKLQFIMVRHRKIRRIRIIAAILAILLALVTTACALTDWLMGMFGSDTLLVLQPGDSAIVEQYELEAPDDIQHFEGIEDLVEYIDEPIYLPMDLPEEFVLDSITIYEEENKQIEIIWKKDSHNMWYRITFNPSYCNEDLFMSIGYEFDYYSKDGMPFECVCIASNWQATGWKDNNEYIISTNDEQTLQSVIDQMTYVK